MTRERAAIDMPFTEVNRIVEAKFAGKDGSGSADAPSSAPASPRPATACRFRSW
jgi:hypothetical protein